MADYTLTPNLGLRVTQGISTNDKYNLTRIDELGSRLSISQSGTTSLLATSDIYITAKLGRGVTNTDGNVFIRAGNLKSTDTVSNISLYARNISFLGKTEIPDEEMPSSIKFSATTIDFDGATLLNFSSAEMSEHLSSYNHSDIALNTAARHSHSNKTILDNTQESFTTALKSTYDAAAAAGGYTSIRMALSATDITNGYITLPITPSTPIDTQCMPQGAPSQFYGETLDYTVDGNKLYFGMSSIWAMGQALEEGDNISILCR